MTLKLKYGLRILQLSILLVILLQTISPVLSATWNYTVTGMALTDTTDVSGGNILGSGGDEITYGANWPFAFSIYGDTLTTGHVLSMNSNGFFRFDVFISLGARFGTIPTSNPLYGTFLSYGGNTDGATTTNVQTIVSGTAPNRVWIWKFGYRTHPQDANAYKATVEVRFYENSHQIRLLFYNTSGSQHPAKHIGINAGDGIFGSYLGYFPAHDTCFLFTPGVAPNIDNPASFDALPEGSSHIRLHWQKNSQADDVMIAVNTQNSFLMPANNTSYNVGQEVAPGLGRVIYKGSVTSFLHTMLSSESTFYYRIWSVGTNNLYSSGTGDSAQTPALAPPLTLNIDSGQFSNQLVISWQKNTMGNNVILAFNTDTAFSQPIQGSFYLAGSSLPQGKGKVIYAGPDTVFTHNSLFLSTFYHYRLWSVDEARNYSTGISASKATPSPVVNNLPYRQSFDSLNPVQGLVQCGGNYPLNIDWTNKQGIDQIDWIPGKGATFKPNTGPQGDHTTGTGVYLYIEPSDFTTTCYNSTAVLESPLFDFGGISMPAFRFRYHMYGAGCGTLSLNASGDGGLTWTAALWTLSGQQQASSSEPWKTATVYLPQYANQSNIKFRIQALCINHADGNIALDDIEVYAAHTMVFDTCIIVTDNYPVLRGKIKQRILGINIRMQGDMNPQALTAVSFNTASTTNPSDILNARLYKTGHSSRFDTITQFGQSILSPSGAFQFPGADTLQNGDNYYWLTYDIAASVSLSNFVAALPLNITAGGVVRPINSNTVRKRVSDELIIGTDFTSNLNNASQYPVSFLQGSIYSEIIYTKNEIGNATNITHLGFYKLTGSVYPDSIFYVRIYFKEHFDSLLPTLSANHPSFSGYTLIYEGGYPIADSTGWMNIELISPYYFTGTKNLHVLVVTNNFGQSADYSNRWALTNINAYRCRWNSVFNMSSTTWRPNIRFTIGSVNNMQIINAINDYSDSSPVAPGSSNRIITRINLRTQDIASPLSSGTFYFTNQGATQLSDIVSARMYYTGNNPEFSTDIPYGNVLTSLSGTFSISGTRTLTQGDNYYWLCYDIAPGAILYNYVSARCDSLLAGGQVRIPQNTAPAIARQIRPVLLIGQEHQPLEYAIFDNTQYSASMIIYLQSEMGGAKSLKRMALKKTMGQASQGIEGIRIFMRHSSVASYSSTQSYSLNDYLLVYEGVFPDNAEKGWMEVVFQNTFYYNGTDNLHVLIQKTVVESSPGLKYYAFENVTPAKYAEWFGGSVPNSLSRRTYRPVIRFEYAPPLPMQYVSSVAVQYDSLGVLPGSLNTPIIRIDIKTSGETNPLHIDTMYFSTTGSTQCADITKAKLWWGGWDSAFTNPVLIDSVVNPFGVFAFAVNRSLAAGNNYFRLTYDLSPAASPGNFLDAGCDSIRAGNQLYIPNPSHPAGRQVIKAPLAGTYIIGQGGDFANIEAAAEAMKRLGISADVTFRILPGTYYSAQTIYITDIAGADSSRKIIVESYGKNSSLVKFVYTNMQLSNNFFSISVSQIEFNNIEFNAYGKTRYFMRETTGPLQYLTLNNCSFISEHSISIINCNFNNLDVCLKKCFIKSRFYLGSLFRAVIDSCTFEIRDFHPWIIDWAQGTGHLNNLVFTNNNLFAIDKSIRLYNGNISTIENNRFFTVQTSALELSRTGISSTLNNHIANNFFSSMGSGTAGSISISESEPIDIFHNTFSVSGPAGAYQGGIFAPNAAIKVTDTSRVNLKNNIFHTTGGAVPLVFLDSTNASVSDYNIFYTTDSVYTRKGNTQYSSLSSWQSTGRDPNSFVFNPEFVSFTDLTPNNMEFKGRGTPVGITHDIRHNPRDSVTPDIGALELIIERDIEILAFEQPTDTACTDNDSIALLVRNKGTQIITQFSVETTINNTSLPLYNWTGLLLKDSTIRIVVGTYSFTSGTYDIFTRLLYPNNNLDQYRVNDTLRLKTYFYPKPQLSGYTAAGYCAGQNIVISGLSATNYSSIHWTSSGTGSFNNPNILLPVYTPSAADIANGYVQLILQLHGTGVCATRSDTFLTAIHPLPVLIIKGIGANECLNTPPISLTGIPSGGVFSGNGITGNSFNPAQAGIGSHSIQYTYTQPSTGCTGNHTHNVQVHALPQVSFTGLPSSVCLNAQALQLAATPPGGVFSGSGVIGSSFNPSIAGAGTHTLSYTCPPDVNGCSNTATQNIIVHPLTSLSISGLPLNCCLNTPLISLSGTPAGGSFSGAGITVNQFNATLAGVGTHLVTYTHTDGNGCINKVVQSVKVNDLPLVSAGAHQSMSCGGMGVSIGMLPHTGHTYRWSPVAGISDTTLSNPIATPTITTVYTLKATDSTTQCSNTSQVIVWLQGAPTASAGNDTTVCPGQPVMLWSGGGNSYQWSTGDTGQYIIVTPQQNTPYVVTVSSGNCGDADTVNISVFTPPKPHLGKDTTICNHHSITLYAGLYQQYLWSTNAQTPSITLDSLHGSGIFWVMVADSNACTGGDSILITRVPCLNIQEHQKESFHLGYFFPNPAKETVEIAFYLPTEAQLQLSLYNILGQPMYRQTQNYHQGNHLLKLNTSYLVPGVYSAAFEFKGQRWVRKLVVGE